MVMQYVTFSLSFSVDIARQCLGMQLEELEIISSIFCGPRELVIDDPGIVVDIQNFIAEEKQFLNQKLDYRIFVSLEGFKDRMEIFAELPHYYPVLELPTVTVSYPNITTSQHNLLKCLVEDALRNLQQTEETYLFQFISWIQDDQNIRNVLKNNSTTEKNKNTSSISSAKRPEKFERLWIYSHHIKSKRKRSAIIENARDLQLTGFSLPGKPGIICVEGYQKDTQEFWRLLKAMHWQRIQVRVEENFTTTEGEIEKLRKFSKFEEESKFTVVNAPASAAADNDCGDNDDEEEDVLDEQNNDGVDNGEVLRLNMSTFKTYLEQHDCGPIMSSLFGFNK